MIDIIMVIVKMIQLENVLVAAIYFMRKTIIYMLILVGKVMYWFAEAVQHENVPNVLNVERLFLMKL